MLDRALHMLIMELSTSRGLTEEYARTMLDQARTKAQLHKPTTQLVIAQAYGGFVDGSVKGRGPRTTETLHVRSG